MEKLKGNWVVNDTPTKIIKQKPRPIKQMKTNIDKAISNAKANMKLSQEIGKLKNQWIEVMAHTNTYNSEFNTFTLSHIKQESYGWSCRIYVPYGLSFDVLEKLQPTIQNNMSCTFLFRLKKGDNFVMAKFITNGFHVGEYEPPKVKNSEVYIGNSCDGTPVIIDMHSYPHILLSGANGSGKSRLLDCILTSLIHNCSPDELELYLVQVAKSDLIIYEDCNQCRGFADNLEKAEAMMEYIVSEMDRIDKLIRPLRKKGLGTNISDYNRLNKGKPLPVRFIVFDEMASLMDSSGDEGEVKKQKQRIIANVEKVAQYGRSLGCFLVACLQRPTASMLSPFVKSQSNLRISFKQNNMKSSEVAMDDSNIALNLEPRIAVYLTYDYDYIKTPFINDAIILKYTKKRHEPGHKTILDGIKLKDKSEEKPKRSGGKVLVDENKKSKGKVLVNNEEASVTSEAPPPPKPQQPVVQQTFNKVDPTVVVKQEQELKANISKIPNFVPYNPNPTKKVNVIDETDIALKPSEKPIKKGGKQKC